MGVDCRTLTYKPKETTVSCEYPPLHGVRKYDKLSNATALHPYAAKV